MISSTTDFNYQFSLAGPSRTWISNGQLCNMCQLTSQRNPAVFKVSIQRGSSGIRPTLCTNFSQKLFQCLTMNFSNLAYSPFFPILNSHVTVFHFRWSRPTKWCSISSFWVTCTAICKERWKKYSLPAANFIWGPWLEKTVVMSESILRMYRV